MLGIRWLLWYLISSIIAMPPQHSPGKDFDSRQKSRRTTKAPIRLLPANYLPEARNSNAACRMAITKFVNINPSWCQGAASNPAQSTHSGFGDYCEEDGGGRKCDGKFKCIFIKPFRGCSISWFLKYLGEPMYFKCGPDQVPLVVGGARTTVKAQVVCGDQGYIDWLKTKQEASRRARLESLSAAEREEAGDDFDYEAEQRQIDEEAETLLMEASSSHFDAFDLDKDVSTPDGRTVCEDIGPVLDFTFGSFE